MTADIEWEGGGRVGGGSLRARAWTCHGCGCKEIWDQTLKGVEGMTKEISESIWACPCSCHDSWKLGWNGGRFRNQLESGLAGVVMSEATKRL